MGNAAGCLFRLSKTIARPLIYRLSSFFSSFIHHPSSFIPNPPCLSPSRAAGISYSLSGVPSPQAPGRRTAEPL